MEVDSHDSTTSDVVPVRSTSYCSLRSLERKNYLSISLFFFFPSRRRHTSFDCDWSSDVCSSDLSTWSAWICSNSDACPSDARVLVDRSAAAAAWFGDQRNFGGEMAEQVRHSHRHQLDRSFVSLRARSRSRILGVRASAFPQGILHLDSLRQFPRRF